MPKDIGDLGMIDLDKFSRAFRLCWLWQEWMAEEKPWASFEAPCNEVDRSLFNNSTTVSIGNGNKAKFWHRS
jgi:hypothetical protein